MGNEILLMDVKAGGLQSLLFYRKCKVSYKEIYSDKLQGEKR